MAILRIDVNGQSLKIIKTDNKIIHSSLNGYKKFLDYTDSYYALKNGGQIETFDENAKLIGKIPFANNHIVENISGNNIQIQVNAS